ncbi:hypothetical protein L1281_000045 [Neisseria sp. HSC-16F19]|nr:hypothetical protein [Neisseria sp. HSC-16F19]MCP2039480.1 hypothetical protein [Neisseria sp. HSC-16F19]
MNTIQRLASLGVTAIAAAGLLFSGTVAAKTVKVTEQNTPYQEADVQKLAATAVSMGVKEPVKLQLKEGDLTVSGSTPTQCTFKVGNGNAPKIGGVNCK